jgi:hypothetical protein
MGNGQLLGSGASWNRSAGKRERGPGPPSCGKKSKLEPSRDGGNVRRDREKPIPDMMEEDQWSTE